MSFFAEGWARVIMVAEICLHDVSVISVIFFLFNLIFFLAICRDACSTFRQPSIRFSTSTPNSPGVTAFAYDIGDIAPYPDKSYVISYALCMLMVQYIYSVNEGANGLCKLLHGRYI